MKYLACTLLVFGALQLYGQSLQLQMPNYGCPMAHCTPHLDDQIGLESPSKPDIAITDVDSANAGSKRGLGCSSNGTIVACSYYSSLQTDPGLKIYNANGSSILTTDQLVLTIPLTHNAQASAPIVFGDTAYPTTAVLAEDACNVALIKKSGATWSQVWEQPIPTCNSMPADPPISPVLLGNATNANLFLFQTSYSGTIYTYNLQTGASIQSDVVAYPNHPDAVCASTNTPAVVDLSSSVSNVYLIDECKNPTGSFDRGALIKLTVNLTNGSWTSQVLTLPANFYPPSNSSPTFVNTTLPGCSTSGAIYFDSSPLASTLKPNSFWGLSADGLCNITTQGAITFVGNFKANAPYDGVNGGLWVWDSGDPTVHLLNVPALSENTSKRFTISLPNKRGTSVVSSAMSLSAEAKTGDIILTFGAQNAGAGYVVAEDVSSSPPGPLWQFPVPGGNVPSGQFPIATDSVLKANYVAFTANSPGTYFVGCPRGGC